MGLTVEKCLQAWINSLKQMNAKADIVFFGDSLIYYGDFASVFPNKVVCNLGLRGDTIQGLIDRVELIKILSPKAVFVMVGINDVGKLRPSEFSLLYEKMINQIIGELCYVKIILLSLLPVNDKDFHVNGSNVQIREYNKEIVSLSAKTGLSYVDLFVEYIENGVLRREMTLDGIHLIKEYYKRWYERLSCIHDISDNC